MILIAFTDRSCDYYLFISKESTSTISYGIPNIARTGRIVFLFY